MSRDTDPLDDLVRLADDIGGRAHAGLGSGQQALGGLKAARDVSS